MTTVLPNEPKIHKHKAETPEQFSSVTCKPHKSMAVITKMAATPLLSQKAAIPIPVTIVAR